MAEERSRVEGLVAEERKRGEVAVAAERSRVEGLVAEERKRGEMVLRDRQQEWREHQEEYREQKEEWRKEREELKEELREERRKTERTAGWAWFTAGVVSRHRQVAQERRNST